MKKTYLLALAAALALPAVAQQSVPQAPPANSQTTLAQQDSSSQPAAPASQSVNDQQNLQATETKPATTTNATGREPLKIETREGFWGKVNPFARKKWTQRQIQPVRDRVNELDELTAQNSKMIKDVDTRATEGIRLATLKATEADQHAVDAGNRAQLAHQTATQASTRLQVVEGAVEKLDQYEAASEIEIRFRPGQGVLSKRAKDALDDVAESLKDQKGYIVEVQGFSSGSGSAAVENSRRMADAVVRYLVINHEIPVYRVFTVGMGNAKVTDSDGKVRRTRGGRVEVHLLKNGIADLQQSASMAQPAPASSNIGQGGVSGSMNMQSQPQPAQQPKATSAPASNEQEQPK
jgi:outer membrane protein OmpA-like peptidoglycan-associated protein